MCSFENKVRRFNVDLIFEDKNKSLFKLDMLLDMLCVAIGYRRFYLLCFLLLHRFIVVF